MKIFLDTANLDDIRKYSKIIRTLGVTTNPLLLSKEYDKLNLKKHFEHILNICKYFEYYPNSVESVSMELLSLKIDDMKKEIDDIQKMINNLDDFLTKAVVEQLITFKVPATTDGFTLLHELSSIIHTNITLIFNITQAIIAFENGAKYISPFVCRIDDIGYNGLDLIKDIVEIKEKYNYETEIIAASIRNIEYIKELAKVGVDIVTIPPTLIDKMIRHPLTVEELKKFYLDFTKNKNFDFSKINFID